jgi:hypothetical protein
MNRNSFIFKPNLYREYYINFHFGNEEKHLFGILGYLNEFEICIVHKGMKVSNEVKEITGFVKKRAFAEKYDFAGTVKSVEHKTHKTKHYTFIWIEFYKPISLSEGLIAIEMANFSEVE